MIQNLYSQFIIHIYNCCKCNSDFVFYSVDNISNVRNNTRQATNLNYATFITSVPSYIRRCCLLEIFLKTIHNVSKRCKVLSIEDFYQKC